MKFPSDFVWGAATSSYQIEGVEPKHGRGDSVWDDFCRNSGAIKHNHSGVIACDHVNRYRDDVALMKKMGLGAYRFSISWPRVMPEGVGATSETGLGFYDRLVDELLAVGIEPWATLFHWDYPLALHHCGGWLNPASPYWFEEYVGVIIDRLSDRVTNWFTINEPQVFVGLGYGTGEHAPGLKLPISDQILISHRVLQAHGLASRTIRERSKTAPRIGWAPVGVISYPATDNPADVEAARKATFSCSRENVWNNTWFDDPAFLGTYPEDGLKLFEKYLPDSWQRDLEVVAQPMDYLGLNIYRGTAVRAGADGDAEHVGLPVGDPRTAFGWEITPPAMYWGPKFLFERYKKPIIISENGLSNRDWIALDGRVHDPQRIDYTARHLNELGRAINDGVVVNGYFHWSLMDNFEWAEGYDQRFGLVYVDFESQERTPKDSASWYANVIKTNGNSLDDPATIIEARPAPITRSAPTKKESK